MTDQDLLKKNPSSWSAWLTSLATTIPLLLPGYKHQWGPWQPTQQKMTTVKLALMKHFWDTSLTWPLPQSWVLGKFQKRGESAYHKMVSHSRMRSCSSFTAQAVSRLFQIVFCNWIWEDLLPVSVAGTRTDWIKYIMLKLSVCVPCHYSWLNHLYRALMCAWWLSNSHQVPMLLADWMIFAWKPLNTTDQGCSSLPVWWNETGHRLALAGEKRLLSF